MYMYVTLDGYIVLYTYVEHTTNTKQTVAREP